MDLTVASRKLKRLEDKTGKILIDRTVKPIKATAEAQLLTEQIELLLRSHDLLIEMLQNSSAESGDIRLMMPATIGEYAPALLHRYQQDVAPNHFSLDIPIDLKEFQAGKSDVLVLTGEPMTLRDVIKIHRGRMFFLALASPSWVASHGVLTHPDQLNEFEVMSLPWNPDGITKILWKHSEAAEINFENLTVSTTASNIKSFALQGYGIALDLPFFYCVDEILKGTLVPVLSGWHRASQDNYIVCSKQSWSRPCCRRFAYWFAAQLEAFFEFQAKRLIKVGIVLE